MNKKTLLSILSILLAFSMLLSACTKTEAEKPQEPVSPPVQEPASSAEPESSTRTITDHLGNTVEIPKDVDRVAATIGAYAHTTALLGEEEKLVATIKELSDTYKKVFPNVNPGGYDTSNAEEVIASGAQVIYGPNFKEEQIAQYNAAGISVVTINAFSNGEQMKDIVTLIAEILGDDAPEKAVAFNNRYDENIKYVQEKTKDIPEADRVKILNLRLSGGNYSTVNSSDISSFYVDAAGGVVVSGDYTGEQGSTSMTVGAEQIVAWAPDVIFTMTNEAKNQMMSDPALTSVPAIKNGRVFVEPTGTYPWSVRSSEGALMPFFLAKIMYPEIFADLSVEDKTKEFYETFYGYKLNDEELAVIMAGQ